MVSSSFEDSRRRSRALRGIVGAITMNLAWIIHAHVWLSPRRAQRHVDPSGLRGSPPSACLLPDDKHEFISKEACRPAATLGTGCSCVVPVGNHWRGNLSAK